MAIIESFPVFVLPMEENTTKLAKKITLKNYINS